MFLAWVDSSLVKTFKDGVFIFLWYNFVLNVHPLVFAKATVHPLAQRIENSEGRDAQSRCRPDVLCDPGHRGSTGGAKNWDWVSDNRYTSSGWLIS